MNIVRNLNDLQRLAIPGSAMCIGVFDGVHLGHQLLLSRAMARAKELAVPSLVFTFTGHPLSQLAPPYAPPLLTTAAEKAALLAEHGAEICVMLEFTAEFAATPPEMFLREIVAGACRARYLVCGRDFHFGAGGAGDISLLKQLAPALNIDVEVCDDLTAAGGPVKSSRVRQSLLAGEIEQANALLGREYSLHGKVVEGDKRGRTIGYPTANLQPPPGRLIPKDGVYAVRVTGPDETLRGAMLNIGTRPTFEGTRRAVEAHIFDFRGDLYGRELEIRFVKRIRDEQKFSGIDELKNQLKRDEETCRAALNAD